MTIDLTTRYLGLDLRSPLVPSASPLADELDNIKRMEDAGAAAVVLPSLFEEQLHNEEAELVHHLTQGTESYAEALTYFPEPESFALGPEAYLDHIRKAKEAVKIPIIASLNGASMGGWTQYARSIQEAGADALELNVYYIPGDPNMPGTRVEEDLLSIVRGVKSVVTLPVAVKLSPFFSNFGNVAKQLDEAGAQGLVLFNRFYQPDIDLDSLEIKPNVIFSTPQALRLPLTWIGILYGRIQADLAATSGIHSAEDVLKMLMVGSSVAMVCSVLFRRGIDFISTLEKDLVRWMEEHEYASVRQMQGSMSQKNCANPAAFERAQYMRAVGSYKLR